MHARATAPRRLAAACAALLALWPPHAAALGPPLYFVKRFEATVVDAETGKPVFGAIVVAHWELVAGSNVGDRYRGELAVRETRTDAIGGFEFASFFRVNPGLDDLRDREPRIIVFKDGYEFTAVSGNSRAGAERLHGGQIRIKAFTGTPSEYAIHLRRLKDRFHFGYRDCNWIQAPRLTAALLRKSAWFQGQGIPTTLATLEDLERDTACGSARGILGPLLAD